MNDEPKKPEESRIHVDDDWKKRARAEREPGDDAAEQDRARTAERGALPEPTLATHLTQLVAEATVALGDMDHPVTRKREPDLALAKYVIDSLAMLKEKTEGNRDEAETYIFDEALYGLRLRFVALSKQEGSGS